MRSDHDIEQAMSTHGDAIWRICRMRMGQEADAQDVFQDTFLAYAQNDNIIFNGAEHERAWLIRVATNRCLDMLRSRAHGPEELHEESLSLPTLEMSDYPDSALWEVAEALNKLPPDQRQALYLTVCEEIPTTEVAGVLSVPVNTVYSWVARGKQRLREALG